MNSDAENIIINNLAQFFDIQKEVKMTTNNGSTDYENGGYKFWEFLKNWHTQTLD